MDSWIIFARKTNRLERKYVPLIAREILRFRNLFIKNLRVHGKEYAVQRLQLSHLNPSLIKIVQGIYKEGGLLGAKMTNDEVTPLLKQKAANFGRNQTWISDVLNFLRVHLLKLMSKITDTMRDDILRVLEKAAEGGWSIDKTVDELQRKDVIRARARVIARTEIVRAANVGHEVGAKSIPYEMLGVWNAANDHRTRHSHKLMNKVKVEENELFKVPRFRNNKLIGYDLMKHPGDPTASAENVINCRCRKTFEPKRDSQGNLIPKRTDTATIIPLQPSSTQIPAHQIAAALKAHIHVGVE